MRRLQPNTQTPTQWTDNLMHGNPMPRQPYAQTTQCTDNPNALTTQCPYSNPVPRLQPDAQSPTRWPDFKPHAQTVEKAEQTNTISTNAFSDSVGNFAAVCWVFGKNLHKALGYSVGLIDDSWGGTIIEAWSSPEALAKCGVKSNTPRLASWLFLLYCC